MEILIVVPWGSGALRATERRTRRERYVRKESCSACIGKFTYRCRIASFESLLLHACLQLRCQGSDISENTSLLQDVQKKVLLSEVLSLTVTSNIKCKPATLSVPLPPPSPTPLNAKRGATKRLQPPPRLSGWPAQHNTTIITATTTTHTHKS